MIDQALSGFTRKLQASIYVQLRDAGLTDITTRWTEDENVFLLEVNKVVLTIRCYHGDGDRMCALVDMQPVNGRAQTMQLLQQKTDSTKNPRVRDALGAKLTFAELVT